MPKNIIWATLLNAYIKRLDSHCKKELSFAEGVQTERGIENAEVIHTKYKFDFKILTLLFCIASICKTNLATTI